MGQLHYSPALGAMAKCTTPDNCPFAHWNTDAMKRMAPITLKGTPEVLKHSYIGIRVLPEAVAPALNQLRTAMAPELFNLIMEKKIERDSEGHYHMSIVRPPEFRKFKKAGLSFGDLSTSLDFELLGVGTASNSSSQTWYAIAQSRTIDDWRSDLALPTLDLHITLGFTAKDIHDVPKGRETLV